MKTVYYILGAMVLIGAIAVPQTTEAFAYWVAYMAAVIIGLFMARDGKEAHHD